MEKAKERRDTKEFLFLTAERLFSERGFDAVSVRDITSEAGANLAAVSYYFGSKDGLLLDIFMRRTRELSGERVRMLREAESKADGAPALRDVLLALLGPPVRWRDPASGRAVTIRFITRAISEPTAKMRDILESDVSHLRPFVAPLARALPHLSDAEVCWRLHLTLGLLHQFNPASQARLRALSEGRCDGGDIEAMLARLIDFAVAGFIAPAETPLYSRSGGVR